MPMRLVLVAGLLATTGLLFWIVAQDEPPLYLVCGGLVLGLLAVTVGVVAVAHRLPALGHRRRAHALAREGVALLEQDRPTAARERFEEAAQLYRGLEAWHAMAIHNVAVALLAEGELDRAIDLLEAVVASGWPRSFSFLQRRGHVELALAFALALAGDVDRAERSLREGAAHWRRRPGWMFVAEAAIAARRERWAEAARFERDWAIAERDLDARRRRTLRVLLAYLLARGGAKEASDRWIASIHPLPLAPLLPLSARWPELRDFLAGHGVAG